MKISLIDYFAAIAYNIDGRFISKLNEKVNQEVITMIKRAVTAFITAIMILTLSGCGIGGLSSESKSDNASAVENVSVDESKDNGSKDPDSAESLKEYVELRFGPVAGDFDTEITVDDDKSWVCSRIRNTAFSI